MSQQNTWQSIKADYLKLLPILALAFYLALMPHLNYPYPVHIDEWDHLVFSKAILQASSATFIDPFYGQSIIGLSTNLEVGFHAFWGVFHQISGISWLTIFKYFPAVIFMITALSAYTLAQRRGFGWEAALFTCFIPTTVGILGPGFMVPVAMGLLFIALSLFVGFNFKSGWSYVVLFVFTCFMVSMHAPTAIGLVIAIAPYILLNLKGNFKHSLGITLALAIPFLAPFPWIFDKLLPTAQSLFTQITIPDYIAIPRVIQTYGYLPIAFCLLGASVLAIMGGKRNYGLIFGLLAMLLMLVIFFTFGYGVFIVYQRGLMYMMLMMSIVAGAGLMWVKNLKLPARLKAPRFTRNVGYILCIVLVAVILTIVIPDRQEQGTRFYHMIDQEDYEAFVWIKDNVGDDYEKAILDPWKGTAFTAIAEKYVYTKIHSYPKGTDKDAYNFLQSGSTDTDFLRKNGISIVYTRSPCHNPNLVEVRKNVYLLKEAEN